MVDIIVALTLFAYICAFLKARDPTARRVQPRHYMLNSGIPEQVRNLRRLVEYDDMTCLKTYVLDRNAFGLLCCLLEHSGGLSDTKFVTVAEQVAIFLSVIAHHKKNWVVKHDFIRSGRTVSKVLHGVLNAIIMLHKVFLARPTPIDEECNDSWRFFKVNRTTTNLMFHIASFNALVFLFVQVLSNYFTRVV
ncbi:UNVERIFIED_CONTAM: hypothetical protein Sradi_5293200 [Sesamum radiatum]|uniref:DUF8040 domain-containing protein n=1 Tax=Sesamum radiatum TaxID=300843 RepID=A0AAW2LNI0_SESRA